MDIKNIRNRINTMKKELDYILEDLESNGLEDNQKYHQWLKHPAGWRVYRTGEVSAFGMNSAQKWIPIHLGLKFSFDKDPDLWTPMEPNEIVYVLMHEINRRYSGSCNISVDITKEGCVALVDGKNVLNFETGEWIKL